MKKFENWRSFYQNLFKVGLFVLSAALIIHFLPREGKFRYDFQENRPWKYGLMTAPFDFQVYKSNDIIKREQDSILKSFKPYLDRDSTVEKNNIEGFKSDFLSYLKIKIPDIYFEYVVNQLNLIYNAGIVSESDMNLLAKDSVSSVMLVDNKVAQSRKLASFFTPDQAYDAIFMNMPPGIKKETLKMCRVDDYINVNVSYSEIISNREKELLLNSISRTSGMIQRGERIIDKGEIVNKNIYPVLSSLRKASVERSTGEKKVLLGQIVVILFLMILQFIYLWLFRPALYARKSNVTFIVLMITAMTLFTSFVVKTVSLSEYLIPFAILPILVRTFFDSRTAMFSHIVTVLMCSVMVPFPYEFVVLQLVVGFVVISSLHDLTQRSQLVLCAVIVLASYCIMYTGMYLIQEGYNIDINKYLYFLINAVLILISYLLIYLIEWLFGYTSNVTLMELSNINNPLLREFSETSPGSFQHCLQVSNLAMAAAQEINANAQLARTGALYHDIGKMVNPAYFTENQYNYNPHDDLTMEESVKIITGHVTEGLKIARKKGLPLVVRDCIRSHHGTGPVLYFYNKFKREYPDKEVPDSFYYKGSNPSTKETAIIMMADSIEASSRSLKAYTPESISELVEGIINNLNNQGSFKDVPITFRDLEKVKNVFKTELLSIYHTRIKYPEAPGKDENKESPVVDKSES